MIKTQVWAIGFQKLKCNELKNQEEDFYKTDIEDSWNGQYFDGYLWRDKDTYWRLFASLFVSDLKHICIFKNKPERFNDLNAQFNMQNQ